MKSSHSELVTCDEFTGRGDEFTGTRFIEFVETIFKLLMLGVSSGHVVDQLNFSAFFLFNFSVYVLWPVSIWGLHTSPNHLTSIWYPEWLFTVGIGQLVTSS